MKKTTVFFAALLAALLFYSCTGPVAPSAPDIAESTPGVTFTDALGHAITVEKTDTVAALMGSFAELWLTAGGTLAGVTDDAYSERGLDLPNTVVQLGSYKSPNIERVIALQPDLVILSADTDEHVALYETLKDAGITAAYFSVMQFNEYLDTLKLFTSMTGRQDLYEQNGLAVQARVDAAVETTKGHESPSVLFIRTFSSGFRALGSDSMTGTMLKDLGAENIADRSPSLLQDLSLEAVITYDPAFIFVVTMGADTENALDALYKGLQDNPAWAGLSAVKAGRYYVLPRELFHYKPNARWGESYEYLAKLLYGE